MTINYTEEMKMPMPDGLPYNWIAIFNGIVELLDKGAELTFTFGETVAAGDVVALKTDGKIYKAKATSSTLTPAIGFAPNAVTINTEGKVRYFGWIDVDTSYSYNRQVSFSPGDCVYCSSIAGRLSKASYSYANALGFAKAHTTAGWLTRIVIKPIGICT
jgi:hypothetical protein